MPSFFGVRMPFDPSVTRQIDGILNSAKPRHALALMLGMADCYNQTAELALGRMAATNNADYAAPALMNRSFAIELLLKLFIVAADLSVKTNDDLKEAKLDLHGHVFSKLFARLDQDSKKSIAKRYQDLSGEPTSYHRFNDLLIKTGDKPFVEWRYAHEITERKDIDFNLLTLICESLGQVAFDLVKTRTQLLGA